MRQAETAALSSVRVVEVGTGIAGSVAGMILGDYGAEVLKVEPPKGDGTRSDPGFAVWNRNKQSIVLDPDDPDDGDRLLALLEVADLCITGGGDDPRGDTLVATGRSAGSRLVVLSLPPDSPSTPWVGGRESDGLLSAVTGLGRRQSSFEEVPVDLVYPHAAYLQGVWGATCALAALVEREQSGRGQVVTVDGLQTSLLAGSVTSILNPAEADRITPPPGPGGPSPCYTRYACADGQWLFLGALSPKFQHRALHLLGLSDLLHDERLGGELDRMLAPQNSGWVRGTMAERFRTRPRDEWLELLDAADCPAGPLLSRDDWLDHPQIRSIGMRIEIDDPERGVVVMPGVPMILNKTPGAVRHGAPRLGADSIDELGWLPRNDRGDAEPDVVPGRGPLHGVRILNLGTVLAGPYAGYLLSDLGADVVKVEGLAGDTFRVRGFAFNRGARSLAIDLRSDRGREAFYELVRSADVVLDNFRPGVMSRLSIDYPSLADINPSIITMSLTGFGDRGPLSSKPGFDPILQAMSGMMSAQGGDGEPVFLTIAVNDVAAACFGALSVCLSLFHRIRTGEGQAASGSLAALSAFMQSGELARFADRAPARRGGNDFPGASALERYYRTRDGWVRLQARSHQVADLVQIGWLPRTVDGTWSDEQLAAALAEAFLGLAGGEAVARLAAVSIPAGVAIRPVDLLANPKVRGSDTFHEYRVMDGGSCFAPGRFAHFSRTQQGGVLVAPGLGEHSREVLAEAGCSESDVDRLLADRIVVEAGPLLLPRLEAYR